MRLRVAIRASATKSYFVHTKGAMAIFLDRVTLHVMISSNYPLWVDGRSNFAESGFVGGDKHKREVIANE